LFQNFTPFIFLLAQENEPKEGHPAQISGRYALAGLLSFRHSGLAPESRAFDFTWKTIGFPLSRE
jgi:hypothetical protein